MTTVLNKKKPPIWYLPFNKQINYSDKNVNKYTITSICFLYLHKQ